MNGGTTHLIFRMGQESYASPVERVEEVLEPQKVTVVPRCPPYLLGVINVRGTLIPVVDLKIRFGVEAGEADEADAETEGADERHILVMRTIYGEEEVQLGLRVDGVEGVVDLDTDAFEPPPSIGGNLAGSAVNGMAHYGDRILLVVDPDALLPKDQLDADFDRLEQGRGSAQ